MPFGNADRRMRSTVKSPYTPHISHRLKSGLLHFHRHTFYLSKPSSFLGPSRFLNGSTRSVTGVLSITPSSSSAW